MLTGGRDIRPNARGPALRVVLGMDVKKVFRCVGPIAPYVLLVLILEVLLSI